MPIIQLPNGEFAMVDDNASPQAIARIMDANKAKPGQKRNGTNAPANGHARKPLTEEEREIQRRADFREKSVVPGGSVLTRLTDRGVGGLLWNFDDELAGGVDAATRGVFNAVRKGDAGEIGKAYRIGKGVAEEGKRRAKDQTGGTVAEIAGAVANPVQTGAKGLQFVGNLSPKLARLAGWGTKLENASPIAQGVTAGALQGGLNELGASDDKSFGDFAGGAVQGAIGGGLFGGAIHGGRRIKQIMGDRTPEAAERTAYSRIAQLLEHGKLTPGDAAADLRAANANGGDAMVMDLLPSLRATGAAISRKPNVPRSNELIQRGEERILARPERFEQEIRAAIKPRTGQDADALKASIRGGQQAHGQTEYARVLDGQFMRSPEIDKFLAEAPDAVKAALRDGVKLAELHGQDIGKLGARVDPTTGGIVLDAAPSMRVWDYAKRAMDDHIGSAFRAGNKALAGGLSNQLNQFKKLIMDVNPDYAPMLATQRDYFQRANAVETGLDVIKRMRREPKVVLKELNALDPNHIQDARTGIIEAITGLRATHDDPVKFFRSTLRTPAQRKIMEFAFDGKSNLAKFEKWLANEGRSAKADVLTAPGRQSETNRFDQADESLKGQTGGTIMDVMRGYAYGGPAGAVAAGTRKFHDLRSGVGDAAMDEIAKILLSNGVNLPKGVSAAQKFQERRSKANSKAAIAAAKAGGQLFTGYGG